MKSLPKSANRLIQEFSNLPGIGRKTAQRLTFHILKINMERVSELSNALIHVKRESINVKSVMASLKKAFVQYVKIPIEMKILSVLWKILMT